MSVVLVLEPDGAQAEQLLRVLRKRVRAEAILVTSPAAAIEVIENATPDLILVSALLSPRDEDRLMAHLRTLENAPHLQTLTIPRLAAPGAASFASAERNALGRFRKKKPAPPDKVAGCDPDVFAAEITAHLARAHEIRSRPVPRKVRREPPPGEVVAAPSVVEEAAPDFTSVLCEPEETTDSGIWLRPDAIEPVEVAQPIALAPEPESEPDAESVWEPVIFEEAAAPVVPPAPLAHEDSGSHLERLARRFGFGAEMFKVAEPDAPPALAADLTSQWAPAKSVIDHSAEQLAAERLAAEQAAVEAETRLAAELERVRAEGEARRLAELARLQAEAEIVRDAAITEARAAAAREAREALASELTRVRSEAEGVFAADLARVRAEVEDKLSTQVQAAETRLAQAEQARNAAELAAAAALSDEVGRVRDEAEMRLQTELERIRTEAEAARVAELSVAKHATQKIREAAAREAAEARASAEASAQRTLEAEMARVRAQADTFLQTEIARVRADAQERQAAELQELRAQMAEIRDTAARTAAEQSADYYKAWLPTAEVVEASPAAVSVKEELQDVPEEIDPALLGRHLPWVKWAVPTAACMLLIANIGSPAKTAAPIHIVEPVEEKPYVEVKTTGSLKVTSTPAGARLLVDGRSYGQTPATVPDLAPGQHTLVLRTAAGGSITRKVTIRAGQTAVTSEAIFSGWLTVYSAIPVTISLNGKPAAAASDDRIMTAPGSYEVTLVNERFNYHGTKTLDVRPGEVTAYTVSLPSAHVHIIAPEGADITVDGASKGKAPIPDMSLPLGTHEITAALPDAGGQRSATVAVRYGEVNQARLEF